MRLLPTPASPMRARSSCRCAPHATSSTALQSSRRSSWRATSMGARRLRMPGRERARVAQRGRRASSGALCTISSSVAACGRPDALPAAPRVRRELEAVPRLLLEEAQHELAGLRRARRRGSVGGGTGVRLWARSTSCALPSKTSRPAEDAVHHAAERVEVGRRAHERRLPADLLGRDPAHRARAGVDGDLGRADAVEPRVVPVLAQPREAQVEHERAGPERRGRQVEHDVRGLEVAVDDAARVRVREAPPALGRPSPR